MSNRIINGFCWDHIEGDFSADSMYGKIPKSPDTLYHRIRVPKRLEAKWSGRKRDMVSNACIDRIDEPYNYAYIVHEYGHAKALIKLIMDLV